MNITRLRYFHAIAKVQSFRRAAEVLGVSQPSLSRQIQILEHECSAELLKRVAKRVVMTQAGEALFSRLGKLFEDMDDLQASLAKLGHEQRNRLLVGSIQSTLDYPIPKAIGILRSRHPRLVVAVRGTKSSEIIEGVSRGQIDVGIVATPVADPRIAVEPITRERFFAVFPQAHSGALGKQVRLDELSKQQLIAFPRGFVIRDMIDLAAAEDNVTLRVVAEIESIAAIKSMVRGGFGMSILPRSATLGPISGQGLTFVPIQSSRLVRDIVAARLSSNEGNTLVNKFVDALRHVYRQESD